MRRSLFVAILAALVLGGPAPAGAATSQEVAAAAVDFIATQQRADGGFGTAEAGFPGFETPDAVLALAEEAQTGSTWSTAEAAAAVEAVTTGGKSGLDYLGNLADGDITPAITAGQAAKFIVVAKAVGESVTAFDPDGEGDPVDLVATMDAGNTGGSFGTFNDTLTAAVAHLLLGRAVPTDTLALVEAAQQANGGWGFAGDPTGTDEDPDTTGLALQALVAAGRGPLSRPVRLGVAFLARLQVPDGGFPSPFSDGKVDPNSTALAILGLTAAGQDVTTKCWKGAQLPGQPGPQFRTPDDALRFLQAADGHIASPNDGFGVNTFATSQAVEALLRTWQPVARAATATRPCPDQGYRLVAADGGVFAFGTATFHGSTGSLRLNAPVVGLARTPSDKGYWLAAADGGVFAFGDAPFLGSAAGLPLRAPVVAIVATPTGLGYWLFAADGGVFAFGDARFLGSVADRRLNQPVVGAAATPSGDGYWMVARDGGVFALGDAPFFPGDLATPANVVGMGATADGRGYWLVAADARIVARGDADSYGGVTVSPLNRPLVGMRPTFNGQGYWLVAADGGIFTPGNSGFFGSTGALRLNAPVVGMG